MSVAHTANCVTQEDEGSSGCRPKKPNTNKILCVYLPQWDVKNEKVRAAEIQTLVLRGVAANEYIKILFGAQRRRRKRETEKREIIMPGATGSSDRAA